MTRVQTNGVQINVYWQGHRKMISQTSFYWQGHRKLISQLVRSERTSLYVDPRIAGIPETVCANEHIAATVDNNLVPMHSDL